MSMILLFGDGLEAARANPRNPAVAHTAAITTETATRWDLRDIIWSLIARGLGCLHH
jgi:hypothetical protein